METGLLSLGLELKTTTAAAFCWSKASPRPAHQVQGTRFYLLMEGAAKNSCPFLICHIDDLSFCLPSSLFGRKYT